MKKFSGMQNRRLRSIIQTVAIALASYLVLFFVLLTGISPDQYDIHVGLPAGVTILATKDVEDSVTTQELKDAAAAAVEPSYKSVDTSINAVVVENMQRMYEKLMGIRDDYATLAPDAPVTTEMLAETNRLSPIELSLEMLSGLLRFDEPDVQDVFNASILEVQDTLNAMLPEGQENSAVTRITRELINDNYPSELVSISSEVLRSCIQPNMPIDNEITDANRQKAMDAIETETLVKGEVIVREGDIVTEAQYQMIANLGLLDSDELDLPLIGGLALLILVLLAIIALFLKLFSPEILHSSKRLLLLAIIIVLEITISLLVRDLNTYLMPVALSAILISLLLDTRTALFVNGIVSFLVSMLVASGGLFSMTMFSVMLMAFAAGPVVSLVLSRSQLRTATLLAGLVIGVCNFLVTFSVGLINSANVHTVLSNACWAIAGGLFSAVLSVGLQSLLEWLFNVPTNAKLIELSNPNQPLLRRLLLEAPGTYHHSIIVANLAEAGATAVEANGLLARVGAYYHDVGKLKRPVYFKENQLGDNPHDRTDPRVSTAILTAHPRDGAQMAAKERIPEQVQDIIRQHHGDSLVLYFYDKAVKLYGEGVDISAFRYDGPRPRSKEAAIVMLADTIEAATRTLANPNPEKMEQLIRKLVRGKLNDGQLNESALTFSDLDKICGAFSTVLTGVFHERIEYPDIAIPPREDQIPAAEKAAEASQPEAAPQPAPAAEAQPGTEPAEALPPASGCEAEASQNPEANEVAH